MGERHDRPGPSPAARLAPVLLASMLLAAPAWASDLRSRPSVVPKDAEGRIGELREVAVAHGLDPEEIAEPQRLSEEIKAWAAAKVPRGAPPVSRLKILLDGLQALDFEYQAGYTGTAAEVFATGKFNCLSFSMLFVSLAREMGLPAYYLKVERIQSFEKDGDLVVVSGHVTAGYGFVRDRTVLEFDVGPEINYRLGEAISDLEALALYYSNRGAELLRAGDNAEAAKLLLLAATLGPDLAQTWVNLGVARRRSADLRGAEKAHRKAIEIDAGTLPAYQNLATVLRLRGETDAAGELLELLDRRHNLNPFTYLSLGDWSLEKRRLDEAERFFRRALKLARHEAEPHAAMGMWALAAGRRDKARSWLKRARQLDAGDERTVRLQERIEAAGG